MSTATAEAYPPHRLDRMKVVKALMSVVHTHPAFLYQLIVFARFPSLLSAALVVVGLFANHLAVNLVVMSTVVRGRREIISGCLDRLRDFTFTRHSIREFLEPAVHDDINQWYVRRLLRAFRMDGVQLDEMVKIHVTGSPTAVMGQLSCYSDPLFFGSYIFIPDPPEDTRGLRRFFVLHEIGHTQMRTSTHTSAVMVGMWAHLFFLVWVAATAPWSATTLLVVAAYVFAMMIWREEWRRSVADMRLKSEILADCFALGYLSPDELARLAGNRRISVLLDQDMDGLQNATRLAMLQENIQLALRGDDDTMLARTFSAVPDPGWAVVMAGVGLVAIVGFCGAPPDARTFLWLTALAGVLLLWFFLLFALKLGFEGLIERRLGGRGTAAPAAEAAPAVPDC